MDLGEVHQTDPSKAASRRADVEFAVLLAVLFCNMVGLGAVFALLPDLQTEHDLPTAGLGLIGGASVLVAVTAQLTLARFADRGHTVLMLRCGLVSMIVGFAWMAAATDLWQFVASRALTGLGAGLFVPACRRVIVARDPARAGELLGRTTAVEVAGFVLGPPLAVAIAAGVGLSAPFALAAAMLLLVGAVLLSITEPPVAASHRRGGVWFLVKDPAVKAALLIGATVNLSVGAFEPVMAKQLRDGGASNSQIAFTLAMFGVPYVFLTSFGGRIADRHGPHRVAVYTLAATTPVVAMLGFATTVWAICAIGVLRAVIDTVSTPAGITAMARAAPPPNLAAGQGLYGAVSNTMAGVAAIVAAPLYGIDGPRLLWLSLGGVMLVCVLSIARLVRVHSLSVISAGVEPALGA